METHKPTGTLIRYNGATAQPDKIYIRGTVYGSNIQGLFIVLEI